MNDLDAHNMRILAHGLLVMAALLGLQAVARIILDRVFAPNDARRRLAYQVVFYGGAALFVVIILFLNFV
jgi:hypothetical protein